MTTAVSPAATEALCLSQIVYVHKKHGTVVIGSSFVSPTTKLSKPAVCTVCRDVRVTRPA